MDRPVLAPFGLGALAAAASLATAVLPASAVQVMVGGETYEVTVEEIAFQDQPSLFDLPANGGMLPWWGDSGLASDFAEQVGDALGPVSSMPGFSDFGPMFAFDLLTNGSTVDFVDGWLQLIVSPANSQFNYQATPDETLRYAVGVLVTSPQPQAVPSPIPVFGASMFFGWSRQLRKRMRTSSRESGTIA